MNYDPKDERTEWRSDEAKTAEAPEEMKSEPAADESESAPEHNEVCEPEAAAEPETVEAEIVDSEPQQPAASVEPPVWQNEQPAVETPSKTDERNSRVFVGVLVALLCVVVLGTAAAVISAMFNNGTGTGTPGIIPGPGTQSTPSGSSAPGVTIEELVAMESKDNLAPKDAYQKILPSVVVVRRYEQLNSTSYAEGTGFIISEDGYIITNEHVVADAALVTITTGDEKTYQATVIAKDAESDIAVLKIEAKGLTVAEFASSDAAQVGQFVMAVGNPTGSELSNSATFGILSGKGRVSSSDSYRSLLQIDAAINPGNSGGPVINLAGQVIGVVSSKIAGVNYEGIGFAVASDQVIEVVRDLLQYGYVRGRVRMGVTIVELTSAEVVSNNLPGNVVVYEVNPDSDAAKKGLRINDIITAIDGETVTSSAQLISIIRTHKPGDSVTLSVYRSNGGVTENLTIVVQLHEYISE